VQSDNEINSTVQNMKTNTDNINNIQLILGETTVQSDNEINSIIQNMTTANTDPVDKEKLLIDDTRKQNKLRILIDSEFRSKPSNYTGGYLENVAISNKIVSDLPNNIREIRFNHELCNYVREKMSTALKKTI